MLKKNKSLKKLNLGSNIILFFIVNLIIYLHFYLDNNIGNEGFKYLIEALKENTSLQELNLRSNYNF